MSLALGGPGDCRSAQGLTCQSEETGEGWVPLGYTGWASFCDAEFGISPAPAYRLLDVARALAAIDALYGALIDLARDIDAGRGRVRRRRPHPLLAQLTNPARLGPGGVRQGRRRGAWGSGRDRSGAVRDLGLLGGEQGGRDPNPPRCQSGDTTQQGQVGPPLPGRAVERVGDGGRDERQDGDGCQVPQNPAARQPPGQGFADQGRRSGEQHGLEQPQDGAEEGEPHQRVKPVAALDGRPLGDEGQSDQDDADGRVLGCCRVPRDAQGPPARHLPHHCAFPLLAPRVPGDLEIEHVQAFVTVHPRPHAVGAGPRPLGMVGGLVVVNGVCMPDPPYSNGRPRPTWPPGPAAACRCAAGRRPWGVRTASSSAVG
ncbi:hypothetical protein E6W17_09270 [Streptomyces sp. A1547]|nr:hypothetical protein E6W17_09270 [Streptomyces sp. A1547]